MLAYRHAFHAGNHADVLKHLVLCEVLRHMAEKEKPFTLIDTHAGAGGYSLEGRYAQKTHESDGGIARLWGRDDLPPQRRPRRAAAHPRRSVRRHIRARIPASRQSDRVPEPVRRSFAARAPRRSPCCCGCPDSFP